MDLLHIYKSVVNIYILEEKNIFNKVIYWIFVRWAYFVPKQAVSKAAPWFGLGKLHLKSHSIGIQLLEQTIHHIDRTTSKNL